MTDRNLETAEPIKLERRGPIAIVTLCNPPLNVVTRPLTLALERTVTHLGQNDDIRAVVLTGEGPRAFCAGSDITEFAHDLDEGEIVANKLALQNRVFSELDSLPKPTIAAVSGLAFGGGLEIAICCDLLVADSCSRFALPEIKLGVFPGSAGTIRVTRRVGEGRAKEMMFLGEPIDAATALNWGLINRVVPDGQSLQAALQLAGTLAARPRLALAKCKSIIDLAWEIPQEEAITRSMQASDIVFRSAEKREGVTAFLQKRAPDFTTI